MTQRFEGKKALITGGTSGFGLEAAKIIAAEGGTVAVTGHSDNHLDDARKALPEGSLVLKNDAADPAAAKELASTVKEQMGSLDLLWLNAGYGKFQANDANDAELFDAMMNTNVRGPVLQMAGLIGMLNEGGSVLLSSSVAPYLGQAQGAVYAATKAACASLTRSWASELAGRNIRVNSVCPGPIATNFVDRTGLSEEDKENFRERVTKKVPLGRMGEAVEVANVALFLFSDEASYVTGSEYVVDGGMTKR
tara:strand:- start:323 stop:1075 length:753 start_codon:yes stop_codon:yes gene_type:complete